MICSITQAGKDQINKLCEENDSYAVSLNIKGGGCADFEYDWDLVKTQESIKEEVEVIECGSGRLIIGGQSIMFLFGSTIDYKKDVMGAMFDIQNPNAKSACGCGVSVNFDDSVFANG